MTTLVITMGDAMLELRVPIPKEVANGGGEQVFVPATSQSCIFGDRGLELAATASIAALVESP